MQLGSLRLGKVTRDYRRKAGLFCADAIWLPRQERELETDWLTPLCSSFLRIYVLCLCHAPLSSLPLYPSHLPFENKSVLCSTDGVTLLGVGLSKAVAGYLPCMRHSPLSSWCPHSVTLHCDANHGDTTAYDPNHAYKCLREEWSEMHKMWLSPPRSLQPIVVEKAYTNETPREKSLTRYN